MIQQPRRSVTRFFIPLIDVLILMFCIFLLMPMVEETSEEREIHGENPTQRQARLLREHARILRDAEADRERIRQLEAELEALRRQQRAEVLRGLRTRSLEIDGKTGQLYFFAPERVEIRNAADAQRLIDADCDRHKTVPGELHYVINYPRDTDSPFPTSGQVRNWREWFRKAGFLTFVPLLGGRSGGG